MKFKHIALFTLLLTGAILAKRGNSSGGKSSGGKQSSEQTGGNMRNNNSRENRLNAWRHRFRSCKIMKYWGGNKRCRRFKKCEQFQTCYASVSKLIQAINQDNENVDDLVEIVEENCQGVESNGHRSFFRRKGCLHGIIQNWREFLIERDTRFGASPRQYAQYQKTIRNRWKQIRNHIREECTERYINKLSDEVWTQSQLEKKKEKVCELRSQILEDDFKKNNKRRNAERKLVKLVGKFRKFNCAVAANTHFAPLLLLQQQNEESMDEEVLGSLLGSAATTSVSGVGLWRVLHMCQDRCFVNPATIQAILNDDQSLAEHENEDNEGECDEETDFELSMRYATEIICSNGGGGNGGGGGGGGGPVDPVPHTITNGQTSQTSLAASIDGVTDVLHSIDMSGLSASNVIVQTDGTFTGTITGGQASLVSSTGAFGTATVASGTISGTISGQATNGNYDSPSLTGVTITDLTLTGGSASQPTITGGQIMSIDIGTHTSATVTGLSATNVHFSSVSQGIVSSASISGASWTSTTNGITTTGTITSGTLSGTLSTGYVAGNIANPTINGASIANIQFTVSQVSAGTLTGSTSVNISGYTVHLTDGTTRTIDDLGATVDVDLTLSNVVIVGNSITQGTIGDVQVSYTDSALGITEGTLTLSFTSGAFTSSIVNNGAIEVTGLTVQATGSITGATYTPYEDPNDNGGGGGDGNTGGDTYSITGGQLNNFSITGATITQSDGTVSPTPTDISGAHITNISSQGGTIQVTQNAFTGDRTVYTGAITSASITYTTALETIVTGTITGGTLVTDVTGTADAQNVYTAPTLTSASITGAQVTQSTLTFVHIQSASATGVSTSGISVNGATEAITGAVITGLNVENVELDSSDHFTGDITGGSIRYTSNTGAIVTGTFTAAGEVTGTVTANPTQPGNVIVSPTVTGLSFTNAALQNVVVTPVEIASGSISSASFTASEVNFSDGTANRVNEVIQGASITGLSVGSVSLTGNNINGQIEGGQIEWVTSTGAIIIGSLTSGTITGTATGTPDSTTNIITGSIITPTTLSNVIINLASELPISVQSSSTDSFSLTTTATFQDGSPQETVTITLALTGLNINDVDRTGDSITGNSQAISFTGANDASGNTYSGTLSAGTITATLPSGTTADATTNVISSTTLTGVSFTGVTLSGVVRVTPSVDITFSNDLVNRNSAGLIPIIEGVTMTTFTYINNGVAESEYPHPLGGDIYYVRMIINSVTGVLSNVQENADGTFVYNNAVLSGDIYYIAEDRSTLTTNNRFIAGLTVGLDFEATVSRVLVNGQLEDRFSNLVFVSPELTKLSYCNTLTFEVSSQCPTGILPCCQPNLCTNYNTIFVTNDAGTEGIEDHFIGDNGCGDYTNTGGGGGIDEFRRRV